jgi:hypothetical protein
VSNIVKPTGFEAKHITYVVDQERGLSDMLIVKEVVHLDDGRRIPRLRFEENYKRPFWITHKGRRNHEEKKDYELVSNLQEFKSTQLDLVKSIAKVLDINPGHRPQQRVIQRSPYVYGSDVNSSCCIKAEYRSKYPDTISFNTVGGGDIETDVVNGTDDIICMSVSHKENVRLVYLKSWIGDINDPVAETLAEAKRLIPSLIEERNLNIEVLIADTPGQVVMRCIEKLHEWKPDWFAFWNMDFDMSKIIRALEKEGIDLAEVFSDASVPKKYKYFNYRKGNTQKTTASGKVMSINVEDRWNWVTHPATFQCIDAMTVYRITRLANGKDPSYALSAILKKELNAEYESKIKAPGDIQAFIDKADDMVRGKGGFVYYYINDELVENFHHDMVKIGDVCEVKLDFDKLKIRETDQHTGLRWHEVMQTKHKIIYGVYNIVDSIRLEQLDEKTKDLASSITMYSKNSDFKNFNSNPKRLTDDMHFWYLNRPNKSVIGTASDQMSTELDRFVIGHDDWIVTLASYMAAAEGMNCVEEMQDYLTLIFTHVADLDIVSTYPNVSQILNIARETCVMEFCQIQGITEAVRREFGVNLTGGRVNAVEMAQKVLGAPAFDTMLDAYLAHKAKKQPANPSSGEDLAA